jgi:hypothetical protein
MQRSEIPVHRYHFHSGREVEFAQPNGSKLRSKLNFGHAATLDTSHRTYMLAVESLALHINNGFQPVEGYALRIGTTGYSSEQCTGEAIQGGAVIIPCMPDGIQHRNITRSHMGTVVSDPNFLNSYVSIDLLTGADLEPLDPQEIAWISGSFVVYEYVPS